MPIFSYRCMDTKGSIVRGSMDAANLPDLEMRLKRMELDLVDFKLSRSTSFSFGRKPITRADLINFCFHMEQLSGAGVPILEGLADLRDTTDHARLREVVADLIENIEGGDQLSESLMRHPDVFDNTFTALITAGERSGNIDAVFRNLSESLKWQDELAAQTKKIVMYPAFVGTIVLAVTFFLMIFLVPQLISFIKNMGEELPFHTKVLVAVSDAFIHYWPVMLATPFLAYVAFTVWLKRYAPARYIWDGIKLKTPMIGEVLHKIILARFATFFGMMYGSGISILDCIKLCEGIVGNEVVATGIRRAGMLISEGHGVTEAFQNTGMFPPLVLRMLRVGEATGSLDKALRNVSYFYDRDIKELIGKVQAMIEPVMTVVLGMLLAWIMMSVLGPIYDTISKIKT